MESKDFFSEISFKIQNEMERLVSLKGQPTTFRLSIKKLYFYTQ